MEFIGNYKFYEKKEILWNSLNDPLVIKACIDGCTDFNEIKKNSFKAKINIKLGPVNANFNGTVKIKDINPTDSYIIEASASSGQLGYAKGIVEINLFEENDYTLLKYKANTEISGKIVQLGSRLIEGSVKKNTDKFFSSLQQFLSQKENMIIENENIIKNVNKKKLFILSLVIIFITILLFIAEI